MNVSNGVRILEFITFYQNTLHLTRVHCATFYQSALCYEQHEDVIFSRGFRREKDCSDLTCHTILLLFLMQYVEVCKSERLSVTSYFKLSMSVISSQSRVRAPP